MKKILLSVLFSASLACAGENALKDTATGLAVFPIQHATMVIRAGKQTIYVDPTGSTDSFKAYAKPTLILVTDIHGDHMDKAAIEALKTDKTMVIAPKAVVEQLGFGKVMENGGEATEGEIDIEALPMYNITPGRLERHIKGRGNGYVLTYKGKRIYISGDTEDVEEMRALKNIDYAFVCMNLPYTMSVDQAADGVLAFKPKTVIPYHHKGSDVAKFQKLVNAKDKNIQVLMLKWYPDERAPKK